MVDIDRGYPETVSAALSNNPLDYLIPKQDIVPFSVPFIVEFTSNEIDSGKKIDDLAKDITQSQLDDLLKDFDKEEDYGLKNLKFKKAAMKIPSNAVNSNMISKKLNYVENLVFGKTKEIQKSQFIKPHFKVKRVAQMDNKNIPMREICDYVQDYMHETRTSKGDSTSNMKRKKTELNLSPHKKQKLIDSELSDNESTQGLDTLKPVEIIKINVQKINDILEEINENDRSNRKQWYDAFATLDPKLPEEVTQGNSNYHLQTYLVVNLETSLERLYTADKVSELPLKDIMIIQDLCSNFLSHFNSILFDKILNQADDLIDECVSLASMGMKYLRMSLFILCSDIKEKEIYSQGSIKECFAFVLHLFEAIVHPLVNPDTVEYHDIAPARELVAACSSIFPLISNFIAKVPVDETFLTKLEYLLNDILFYNYDVDSEVHYNKLRELCCSTICAIYKSYPAQREFLLTEILSNLSKIPLNRQVARIIRLKGGQTVQLLAFLLVNILQSEGIEKFETDDSFWRILRTPTTKYTNQEKAVLTTSFARFDEMISNFDTSVKQASNTICSLVLSQVINSTDSKVRKLIESLVEDLIVFLPLVEYSSAETLLETMLNMFLYVCNSDKYSNNIVETFSLDMAGLIGSKIIQLRKNKELLRVSLDMHKDSFIQLCSYYRCSLLALEKAGRSDSFYYLNCKFFTMIHSFGIELLKVEESKRSDQQLMLISAIDIIKRNFIYTMNGEQLSGVREFDGVTHYGQVLLSQGLSNHYDNLVLLIVKSLDHAKVKSRSTAIKNLSLLISREPSLLMIPLIRHSIKARLKESYSSVRDSIVDLLTNYIKSHTMVIDEFYEILCAHIGDESVAVQRKAINIAAIMYDNTENINVKVTICEHLLRRMNDEQDSIVKLATNTIFQLWFQKLLSSGKATKDLFTLDTVEVMIELVSKNQKNWKLFERFLKEKVIYQNDNNMKYHDLLMRSISAIVSYLAKYVIENNYQKEDRVDIEKHMGLLAVIVNCDGGLINQDELVYLQPYLAEERSNANSLSYYTLLIFKYALQSSSTLRPQFIDQCELTIINRLTKYNVSELNEAVPCLWLFATMKRDSTKLARILCSSLESLSVYLKPARAGTLVVDGKIQRLLFLIGTIGRYCNLEKNRSIFETKLNLKEKDTVATLMLKHILVFCDDKLPFNLRKIAIRNLIDVCSNNPRMFLSPQCLETMDNAFQSTDIRLPSMVTERLLLFIQNEEAKSIARNGLDTKLSRTTKLDYDVFRGQSSSYFIDSVCTSIIERYTKVVLNLCLIDETPENVYNPIAFLQLIVSLGFANPRNCISTVIALESSPNRAINSDAIIMHRTLYEKHESLIESSYIDGIKLAVSYRKRFSKNIFDERFFLKSFLGVIGGTKKSRTRFFKSLVRSFYLENLGSLIEDANAALRFKDYVCYILRCLSNVNFMTYEEAYIVANGVDKVLSTLGEDLVIHIEKFTKLEEDEGFASERISVTLLSITFNYFSSYRKRIVELYNLSEDVITEFGRGSVGSDIKGATKFHEDYTFTLPDEYIGLTIKELNDPVLSKKICFDYTSTI